MTANNETDKQSRSPKFIHYRLSNDYIRGLTDGEGCFTFFTVKFKRAGKIVTEKMPVFTIAMHVRDRWLITEVAEHLGIADNIYIHKAWTGDGHKRGDMAKFMVRSAAQLKDIIIPFFYQKLAGFKGDQFMEWLENIGNDPMVSQRYKILYKMYKSGYWEDGKNIPKKFV